MAGTRYSSQAWTLGLCATAESWWVGCNATWYGCSAWELTSVHVKILAKVVLTSEIAKES